jgi:hypothetical protein
VIERWTFAICALSLALSVSVPARADETTEEFLASCSTKPKECQDYILMVDIMGMMDKDKRDLTCLPKGFVAAEVVASIIAWLTEHKELAADPPATSIEKAFQARYPMTQACRDTHVRADPFPGTTGEFLAYCANEPAGAKETCYDEIIGVGLMYLIDHPKAYCGPKADPADEDAFHVEMVERVAAIKAWLSQHPELAAKQREDGIEAAYSTLYPPPCDG